MFNLTLRGSIGGIFLLGLLSVSVVADEDGQEIASRVVQRIAPAYRLGSRVDAWRAVGDALKTLPDNDDVWRLDEQLAVHQLPPAAAILAEIRLTPGAWHAKLPRASRREVLLVLEHVDQSIEDALSQRDAHPIFDDAAATPNTFDEFEILIWKTHVYRNELVNAATLAAGAGRFQQTYRSALAAMPEHSLTNYASTIDALYDLRVELHERDLELKLQRLELADAVLEGAHAKSDATDTVLEAKRKVWAAYSLQKDGQAALTAFRKIDEGEPLKFATHLNAVDARLALKQQIEAGRERASDLRVKSENLFDGLHWWFRGRYGRGTHNGGLLKPPNAARSPASQVGLLMPKELPKPTNPAQFLQTRNVAYAANSSPSAGDNPPYDNGYARAPDYDRRHHYIWSQEPPLFARQNVALYFH